MNQRVQGVDNLRGVAALMVVFYHFGTKFYKTDSIFYLGSYGVHIFFVISGFVIIMSLENSEKGIKNALRFLLKRIIRLDPPYIVTIMLIVFYSLGISFLLHSGKIEFEMEKILLHLGYLIPFSNYTWYSPVFWTLGVEFQFYLIVALIHFYSPKHSLAVLSGSLVLFVLLSYHQLFSNEYFIFRYAAFFLAGVVTSGFFLKKIDIKIFLGLQLLSGLLAFLTLGEVFASFILLTTAGAILFFKFQNKILIFFAKVSYSLYLIHYTLMHFFYEIFDRKLSLFISKDIMFGLAICGTILISYLFYMLVEWPAMQYSKRIQLLKVTHA